MPAPQRLWRALAALFLIAAATAAFMAAAWAQQAVPALTARVIDQTGTLGASATQALEVKLAAFEQRKGTQIVVLMVPGTAPEDISAYANRVANAWKIGRRDVGDGVLLIVAKDDRRMRIEVAKTLEGAVPDIAAARIIDQQMKPAFRTGDFAGGIGAALDHLIARIDGEPLPEVQAGGDGSGAQPGFDLEDLAIFLFFAVFIGGPLLRGLFGNKLGVLATGGLTGLAAWSITASVLIGIAAGVVALAFALFSGLRLPASATPRRQGKSKGGGGGWGGGYGGGGGWSSGSSSSSSDWGGGFSSGGGGDFGGGGASGDW